MGDQIDEYLEPESCTCAVMGRMAPCSWCENATEEEINALWNGEELKAVRERPALPGHSRWCRYPEFPCRCGEKPVDGPFNKIGDLPARRGTWRRFGPAPLEDVLNEINQYDLNRAFTIVKQVAAQSDCSDPNLAMKVRDAEGLAEHGHRPVPWPSDVTPEPKKDEPTTHDLPEETLSTIARAFR